MSTRRWVGSLESWMRRSNLSKQEVASRSKHKKAHVLALFEQPEPNPTLRLYLEVVQAAGARFNGVRDNTPAAFVARLVELRDREKSNNVALSRLTSITRPHLSTLFNDPDPNPQLITIDRIVTALGVEADLELVAFTTQTVRLALVAGSDALREAQAAEAEVKTSRQRLHIVETSSTATGQADALRKLRDAEERLEAAEERLRAANTEVAALQTRCNSLHQANVTLEKQRADAEAQLRRLPPDRDEWTGLKIFGVGLASFLAGAGVAAVAIHHGRRK
ncbi:MAG: hypothetical protein R3B09_10390 [Nannocystaceae bacterium]